MENCKSHKYAQGRICVQTILIFTYGQVNFPSHAMHDVKTEAGYACPYMINKQELEGSV